MVRMKEIFIVVPLLIYRMFEVTAIAQIGKVIRKHILNLYQG